MNEKIIQELEKTIALLRSGVPTEEGQFVFMPTDMFIKLLNIKKAALQLLEVCQ